MQKSAREPDLTPRQHKALTAMLNSASIKAAALDASVSERALYGYLADPRFAAEYQRLRREATQQAVARLQQTSGYAVSTILGLMADKGNPPGIRLAAARLVLEFAMKSIELDDLAVRIDALEQSR